MKAERFWQVDTSTLEARRLEKLLEGCELTEIIAEAFHVLSLIDAALKLELGIFKTSRLKLGAVKTSY